MAVIINKPPVTIIPTENWGYPKGVPGRGNQVPKVILLHCLNRTMNQQDALACTEITLKGIKPDHASVHFLVGDGIHQYVDPANIAWAIPRLLTPPIDYNCFNWAGICNCGIPPYLYTIDIGIEQVQSILDCKKCDGPVALGSQNYKLLVRLLAWLAQAYNIAIDSDHIQFHQNVDGCIDGNECLCTGIDQLLIDVANYEEPCLYEAPLTEDGVVYRLIGTEEERGCLVSQLLSEVVSTPSGSALDFEADWNGCSADSQGTLIYSDSTGKLKGVPEHTSKSEKVTWDSSGGGGCRVLGGGNPSSLDNYGWSSSPVTPITIVNDTCRDILVKYEIYANIPDIQISNADAVKYKQAVKVELGASFDNGVTKTYYPEATQWLQGNFPTAPFDIADHGFSGYYTDFTTLAPGATFSFVPLLQVSINTIDNPLAVAQSCVANNGGFYVSGALLGITT